MIKKSMLILFVIIATSSFLIAIPSDTPINIMEIPDTTPISIFLDDLVNMTNATPSWTVELYNQTLTGIGQTICIIDTGINFSHSDILGKNLTCNIDCFAKTCIENCSVSDDHGHGTHVAGIAAANGTKKGIAPDANLIGIKALDSDGNGQISYMVNGIIWCTDNSETYNITTISMSLGTSSPNLYDSYCDAYSSSAKNAINNATIKNISVIAATGNNGGAGGLGNATHISLPSCIENATAVSAINDDDSIASTYANYNSISELFAPGTSINSLSYLSGYTIKSGTSMSTPAVAGAFALLNQLYQLQNNKQPTPDFIQDILTLKGKTIEQDFIRIDILASIEELSKPNTTLITPTNDTETFTQTNFTCNTTSPSNYTIQNLTFYLWNSTSLEYNETKSPTATNNATFNYSLDIDFYNWNCLATDEKNYQSFAESNNTINFTEIQVIELLSPIRNAILTTAENTTFTFNTSINVSNCSLIINNQINITTLNITNYTFSQNLSNNNYNWSINCTTNESLTNSSSTRALTINYTATTTPATTTNDDSSESSGGGGGGSISTVSPIEEYEIDKETLKEGTTMKLGTNDLIKIEIIGENHTITAKTIETNSATLLVKSSPQYLNFSIEETKKISLEKDYYNLEIKLNSIVSNKINISIKEIQEIIDLPIIAINDTTNKTKEGEKTASSKWQMYATTIIFLTILAGMAIIIYFLIKEHEDKEIKIGPINLIKIKPPKK